MNKLTSIFIVVLQVVWVTGCMQSESKPLSSKEEKVYPVKVAALQEKEITRTLEYTANLMAFEEVYFAPASPGRIENILVDIGDRVVKGQTLIEMDKTQLRQAEIQLNNAKSNYKRLDTLYKLESISEQSYEQAKTQYDVAQSNVDFLTENTRLESPLNGIVTDRYYDPQEMYSGAPNTQAGKAAVLNLMQINPLKAHINIPERYYPEIMQGMKATIKADIYKDRSFSGKIYRIHPTIDEDSRSFKTEIMVSNPAEKLRPGMFAKVIIDLKREKTMVAPAIAVLQQEGTNRRYVYINDKGIARKIFVNIGQRFDEEFEISSEKLNEGMELVIAGQANLMDSVKLKVTQQ